jgi:hypothetical protein
MIDGEMKYMEDRRHAHEPEVVRRARDQGRERPQGAGRDPRRRHADQVGRSEDRRGPWQPATLDCVDDQGQVLVEAVHLHVERRHAGPHTITSRATDVNGKVQPTAAENESKKSFLEENSQFARKVTIS